MFITSGWVEFGNGLLWWAGADCVFDWQAAIFLRFDDLGSFTYPCKKKILTSENFGIWHQYFYTVTIHTFITQSFMNSEGLLHCTQTSFNLFYWSNTLKQSWESLYNQGWLVDLFFVFPSLRSLWHGCLWSVDIFCNLEEIYPLVWMYSLGAVSPWKFLGLQKCKSKTSELLLLQ